MRWLPRPQAVDLLLPVNDFWVFDRDVAIVNHFAGNGVWGDGEVKHADLQLITAFLESG